MKMPIEDVEDALGNMEIARTKVMMSHTIEINSLDAEVEDKEGAWENLMYVDAVKENVIKDVERA